MYYTLQGTINKEKTVSYLVLKIFSVKNSKLSQHSLLIIVRSSDVDGWLDGGINDMIERGSNKLWRKYVTQSGFSCVIDISKLVLLVSLTPMSQNLMVLLTLLRQNRGGFVDTAKSDSLSVIDTADQWSINLPLRQF
jgi:hypothetical protein